jgi:hypothetical protein
MLPGMSVGYKVPPRRLNAGIRARVPRDLHHGEQRPSAASRVKSRAKHSEITAATMAMEQDVEMLDPTTRLQGPDDYAELLQTNHSDAFAFSESEKLALQLYDQLRELELQQSLLQAQESGTCSRHAVGLEMLILPQHT